jgi:hypothetical protein
MPEPCSGRWQSRAEKLTDEAAKIHNAFIERLVNFRVLDPACGSGNFLYVALRSLKDLEHRANLDAEALGLPRGFPRVGPECVLGIELNPYAAELARVSVWIGEIQWMRRNGFDAAKNPILRTLDTIECRDAVLAWEQKPSPEQADTRKNSSPERGGGSPLGLTEGAQLPDRAAADRGDPSTASRSPSPFRGGFSEDAEPILTPVRAEWPAADVVVGNPPILRTLDTIECRDAVLAWEPKPSPEQADPRKNSSPERGGGSPLGLTEGAQFPDRAAADRGDPSTASRSPSPFRGGFSEDAEPILIPVRAEWPAADVVVGNQPILRTLDTIECRDAVLAWEPKPSPEQADPRKNSSPERGGGSPLGLTEGAQLPDRAAADRGDPSTASRSPSPFRGGFS